MQTPNTLNITVGTDVILNVTLEHDGVVLNPALIDNLQANLITGLGRKTPLETSTGIDYIVVNIPWVDGRLPGCYSLEITGSINDLAWSAVGKSIIRYTSATEIGSNTVEVDGDHYDVTMEVGYYFTDSPIEGVEVNVDNGVGTPSAVPSYVRRVLGIDFHNLKGNGIKSIEQTTTSEADHGVNIVTITDDLDNATNVEIRNGGTGHIGPQGVPGESAIFDPETGNISVMKQATGNDTNSPMSQDATTRELVEGRRYTEHGEIVSETDLLTGVDWIDKRYINGETGATPTSNGWQAYASIPVAGYNMMRLSMPNISTSAGYCFYNKNGQRCENGGENGSGDTSTPYVEKIVNIPDDAVRLGVCSLTDYQTYGTPYVYGIKTKGGIIDIQKEVESINGDLAGDEMEIKTSGWLAGYIGSDGRGHSSDSYCLSNLINAEGLTLVKSNIDVSISVNCYDKDYNHLGLTNPYGKEFTVLPMECKYFRIWFAHNNIATAPAAVTIKRKTNKLSRTSSLDGKAIVTFGDSITWYDQHTYTNGKASGNFVFGYQHYMRLTGMMVDNQGESGKTMPWTFENKVQSYGFFGNVDYMSVFLGANDSKNGIAVGEIAPIGSTFDTSTYTGALQAIVEHALSQNDNLKVVLFTPIVGWVYQSGKPPVTKREYVEAVKAVGELYSIPVIDLYNTIGLNVFTRNVMINDPEPPTNTDYSLHPSNYGYKRISEVLIPKLADA